MKNKKYLFLAASAALFAACSSNDDANVAVNEQAPAQQEEVGFSVYVNRGTTRAGYQGEITTDILKTNARPDGFGVFAYYADNELYSDNSIPNFMYNQQVNYITSATEWQYSPIKYWPNEFGENAQSGRTDYLTFFAYAPWVDVEPKTGNLVPVSPATSITSDETGIIGMSRNTAKGDPFIKYAVDFNPAQCVDLCYGVASADFKNSADGTNNSIDKGKPFIDVVKPQYNDKISFEFNHALASLNVQIDADVDDVRNGATDHNIQVNGTATRIYVRSVTFEGFTTKGALNLNSDAFDPIWYDVLAQSEVSTNPVTIYDGRRDGREGVTTAAATFEKPQGLNPVLIQNSLNGTAGVRKDAVNLFNSATATDPIFVIPNKQPMKVTIVYDVETVDTNLPTFLSDGSTRGSVVENTITKEITWGGSTTEMEAGKKYTVNLHLGMTTVKFEATEATWVVGDSGNADLPYNGPQS